MDKVVSAANANRHFSEILRGVQAGESYVITSHGKPVARMIPLAAKEVDREAAREALFRRLDTQPPIKLGRWNRDEAYDD